jgi:predicted transcriptional regulator
MKQRSLLFLPVKLVEQANKEGWTRSLAYFIQIKSLYHTGIIYNYTTRRLSSLLNRSHSIVSTHVNILKDKNLIELRDGNLCCKGFNKLIKIYDHKVRAIRVCNENQYYILLGEAARTSEQRQRFKISKKREGLRKKGMKISVRFKNEIPQKENYIGLSCIGFAKMINCSPANASRILLKLKKMGIIKRKKMFKVFLEDVSPIGYIHLKDIGSIPNNFTYNINQRRVEKPISSSYEYIHTDTSSVLYS